MKDKKKMMAVLVITIITILLIGSIIIIVNKNLKGEPNKNNEEEQNKPVTDKLTLIDLENLSSKVTLANYSYDNKYKEYKRYAQEGEKEEVKSIDYSGFKIKYNYGKEYLKDLKVPYINLDSDDAKKVNKILEEKYISFAKNFDIYAKNENDGKSKEDLTSSASQILTYGSYEYKDILSVIVVSGIQSTSPWILDFETYTFDLNTGKLLDFNDIINKISYTKDNVLKKLKDIIPSRMDEVYDKNSGSLCGEESCYDLTYNKIQDEIDKNKISYFVDKDGNLNLITYIYNTGIQGGTNKKYLYKIEK